MNGSLQELESPFSEIESEEEQRTVEEQRKRLALLVADGRDISTLMQTPQFKVFKRKYDELYTKTVNSMANCEPREVIAKQAQVKILKQVADIVRETINAGLNAEQQLRAMTDD